MGACICGGKQTKTATPTKTKPIQHRPEETGESSPTHLLNLKKTGSTDDYDMLRDTPSCPQSRGQSLIITTSFGQQHNSKITSGKEVGCQHQRYPTYHFQPRNPVTQSQIPNQDENPQTSLGGRRTYPQQNPAKFVGVKHVIKFSEQKQTQQTGTNQKQEAQNVKQSDIKIVIPASESDTNDVQEPAHRDGLRIKKHNVRQSLKENPASITTTPTGSKVFDNAASQTESIYDGVSENERKTRQIPQRTGTFPPTVSFMRPQSTEQLRLSCYVRNLEMDQRIESIREGQEDKNVTSLMVAVVRQNYNHSSDRADL